MAVEDYKMTKVGRGCSHLSRVEFVTHAPTGTTH